MGGPDESPALNEMVNGRESGSLACCVNAQSTELLWLFYGNCFSDTSGCIVSVSVSWPRSPLDNILRETEASLTVQLPLFIW